MFIVYLSFVEVLVYRFHNRHYERICVRFMVSVSGTAWKTSSDFLICVRFMGSVSGIACETNIVS